MKTSTNFLAKSLILSFILILLGVLRANATNYVVTNTNASANWLGTANDGSFGGAIKAINAEAAGTTHTITFNIPGAGPHIIDIQSAFTVTNSVSIVGLSQPGATCSALKIVLDGEGWTNLTLANANSVIAGIVFQGMPVTINGGGVGNNHIYNCYFNVSVAGTAGQGTAGATLLTLSNSPGSIVGGVACATRNVFAGGASASTNAIIISSSANTKVVGNYISTAATNGSTFTTGFTGHGIHVTGSASAIVDSNIVAGCAGNGIRIESSASSFARANYVGLGADGITNYTANPNAIGILVTGSSSVSVNNNVVTNSSSGAGIFVNGGTCNNLIIKGNTVGMRADKTVTATNYGNFNAGILLNANSTGTLIDSNFACYNGRELTNFARNSGIYVYAAGLTISNVTISRNYVGVTPSNLKYGNNFAGIYLEGTTGTLSDVTLSANIIGDNGNDATQKSSGVATLSMSNVSIYGNYIGMTTSGADVGNYHNGIEIFNTTGVTIGGTSLSQRNYIGYNKAMRNYANVGINDSYYGAGILITAGTSAATNATIVNNYIGVKPDGTAAPQVTTAGRSYNNGIVVERTSNVVIGGTTAAEANLIANSDHNGILVVRGADYVQIRQNSIYCNTEKAINLNLSSAFTFTPGNNSYAAPVITGQTATTVSGTCPSGAIVEIFYDADGGCERLCDNANKRQGKVYLGTATTTGTTWTYTHGSAFTRELTATATGSCSGGNCRTSEFSTCALACVPPANVDAGTYSTLCATTTSVTLAGSLPGGGETGTWTRVGGTMGAVTITSPGSNTSTVTGLTAGTLILRWTVTNGSCSSFDEATITVVAVPTASAGSDQNLCNVTTTTLAATAVTAPATGAWTVISGTATVTTSTSATSGVTGMGTGTIVLRWTVSNSPCADATDDVTIINSASPTASAGSDQNLCNQTTTTLTGTAATAPATGAWTVISGTATVTSPTSATSGVTGIGTGTIVLRWTVSNGVCTPATDDVTIINSASPTASAGSDQNLCNVTTTTLAATSPTAPATGSWSVISGTATVTTASSATSGVTGMGAGTIVLRWTVSNGTCTPATDDVTIINSASPTANAGPAQNLCNATTTTLAATSPTAPATGAWTVISGTATVTSPTSATSGITGMGTGTIVLRWTVSNGACTPATNDVTIVNSASPTSNAGSAQNLCDATSTTLAATAPTAPATGMWSVISGTATVTTPTSATSGVTGLGIGTIVLRWTVSNGACADATNDVTITNSASPTASAGPDQNLCNATATTLAATAATLPATGTWSVISGTATVTSPANATSGVTGLGTGTIVLRWTVSNGACTPATEDITVTNNSSSPAVAGSDQSLCNVTGTTLAATPVVLPATGAWTVISGTASITDPTSPTSGVTGLGAGTIVLRWTVTSNSSCPNLTDDITITNNATLTADAGTTQNLCNVTTTTLAATPTVAPATGAWTVISGSATVTDPTSATSGVTGLGTGTTVLRWSITSNSTCSDVSDDVTIVNSVTPVSAAGNDQNLCNQTSTALTGTAPISPATGVWTLISGTATITDPSSATSALTGLGTGTIVMRWTVSNGACSDATDDITIVNSATPVAAAGNDQNLCNQSSGVLTGTAVTLPATGVWTVLSGTATVTDPSSATSGITGMGTGTIVLRWTVSNGICSDATDDITIVNSATPVSAAGNDQNLCNETTTTLTGTAATAPATGVWTVLSGTATVTDPTSATSGVTGMATGTIVLRWTVSNGSCTDATDDITITNSAAPLSAAGTDQDLCNQTSTVLSANSPASPATGVWSVITGTATITDPSSATSGVTGLGTGTIVLRWTVSNGICSPSATDDITITNSSTPVAVAGQDQGLCNEIATTLAGTAPTLPATGVWSVISGTATITDPSSATSGVTGLGTGTIVLRWTVSNGACTDATDDVTITNNDAVVLTLAAGPDQDLCNASTTTLAGTSPTLPATGVWSVISGTATVTDPANATSGVTGMATGTIVLRWTISNGACADISDDVTLNNNAAPVATAGQNQGLCNETATTLAGTAPTLPATGAWSVISGTATVTDPTSATSTVTGLGIGTIVLRWTVSNGACSDATDDVTITNSDVPASSAGTAQNLCNATSTILAGNVPTSPATGMWTVVSGTATVTDPANATSGLTGLGTGIIVLRWTVSNGACNDATSDIAISNYPTPVVDAGPDRTLCSGTINLAASTPGLGHTGQWTVSSGSAIFNNATNPITSATGFGNGINTLTWTVTGNCGTSSEDMLVTVGASDLEAVAVAAQDTLCLGSSADISVTVTGSNATPPYSFTWTSSDGNVNMVTGNASITVTPLLNGWVTYSVNVVDANGCAAPRPIEDSVYAVGQQTLIVPNLITPNGDEHNDCLIIRDDHNFDIIPGSKFELYNRWGEAVYKNNYYKNGDFCGSSMADGMYYYFIKTSCDHREIKGWLHIIGNEASNK